MEIPDYITDLLFEHDCVIIPGLGGFVSNYAPARIHPVIHMFYPPSKSVLFNTKLSRDDGLLVDYIRSKEQISYPEAKNRLEKYVGEIRAALLVNKDFRIGKIGYFSLDREKNLVFEPGTEINFLEESFGLPTFVSPPVDRKSLFRQPDQRFIDRRPSSRNSQQRRRIFLAAATSLPVLLLVSWFIFSFPGVRDKFAQQTGIVTFPESPNQDITSGHSGNLEKFSTPLRELDLTGESPDQENKEPVKPEEKEAILPVFPRFYVIGGAFADHSNAEKFLNQLRIQGYVAEMAGISPSGLNMVSYFSSTDRGEALVNLALIRNKENPAAWLLKK